MAMDDDAGLARGAGVDSFAPGGATASPRVPPPQPGSTSELPPATGGAPTPAANSTPPNSAPPTVTPPASTPPVSVPPVAPPPPIEIHIPDEAAKAYIARCLQPQRKWFSTKAAKCKRAHNMTITAQVVATTSIPMLNMVILKYPNFAYVSTAAAAVSGLAAGVAGFGKFKEHWLRYRQNATALENLQLEYELCLPPFHGADRNNLLIASVRKILAEEQKMWIADVKSGTVSKAPGVAPVQAKSGAQSGSDDDDS